MRRVRSVATLVVVLLLLVSCSVGGDTEVPTPTPTASGAVPVVGSQTATSVAPTPVLAPVAPTESVDNFTTPIAAPSPIAARKLDACSGEECNGADPSGTKCDRTENGAYTQTTTTVVDDQGRTLGVLELRANHSGCDSVQWARFTPDADAPPFSFALRVRQNGTGLATAWEPYQDRHEAAWSRMIHSPVERVRAELAIPDGNGGWTIVDFTRSF